MSLCMLNIAFAAALPGRERESVSIAIFVLSCFMPPARWSRRSINRVVGGVGTRGRLSGRTGVDGLRVRLRLWRGLERKVLDCRATSCGMAERPEDWNREGRDTKGEQGLSSHEVALYGEANEARRY